MLEPYAYKSGFYSNKCNRTDGTPPHKIVGTTNSKVNLNVILFINPDVSERLCVKDCSHISSRHVTREPFSQKTCSPNIPPGYNLYNLLGNNNMHF